MASRDWIRHFGSALLASALAGWIGYAEYASAFVPSADDEGLAQEQVYSNIKKQD